MRFRFAEEEDPCDFVTRLAEDAPYFAPEHILQGSYLYDQWEPELVRWALGAGVWRTCRAACPHGCVAKQRPAGVGRLAESWCGVLLWRACMGRAAMLPCPCM